MNVSDFDQDDQPGGSAKLNITVSEQIFASSVGAVATSLLVTPMDVVKIRLQQQVRPLAQGECFLYSNGLMDHLCTNCEDPMKPLSKCEWFNRPGNFNGTLVSTYDAFIKITRHEGVRSLWSGLSPTMLSAIPATVFYYTIYDNILLSLRERLGDRLYVPLMSGSVARAIAATVVSPLELIRTKMQSHRHTHGELRGAIARAIAAGGYQSLWRGLSATLLRDIPFSAIYWTCYESFKREAVHLNGRINFTTSVLCGAGAGTLAAVATMPFDVVKTQQQISVGNNSPASRTAIKPLAGRRLSNGVARAPAASGHSDGPAAKFPSTWSIMRRIVERRGASALFAGLVPRIARVAPACAIMIGSYEHLKLFFNDRRKKSRRTNNV